MKRGEVWIADFGVGFGHEQAGRRPVLIISNDVGNKFSPVVTVAAMTTANKRYAATQVPIEARQGLKKDSKVLLEQTRTIDKKKLHTLIARISDEQMQQVNLAIRVAFDLID